MRDPNTTTPTVDLNPHAWRVFIVFSHSGGTRVDPINAVFVLLSGREMLGQYWTYTDELLAQTTPPPCHHTYQHGLIGEVNVGIKKNCSNLRA